MTRQHDDMPMSIRSRCYVCGHRLAFPANACPQCRARFDNRAVSTPFPEHCSCDRCTKARARKGRRRGKA